MSRTNWQDEPARETAYRKLHEQIATQDRCITWLLDELRKLQKRVDKLEKPTNAALRKLAHNNVEAVARLDKCNGL